jgi:MFS family permease
MTIYITPNSYCAFGELAVFAFANYSLSPPLWATIQSVVPDRMRATAVSVIYLFANLIGGGLGPVAVGAVSDALVPWAGSDSLRYALVIVSPGFLWGAWHLWRGSATVVNDIETVQLSKQPGIPTRGSLIAASMIVKPKT